MVQVHQVLLVLLVHLAEPWPRAAHDLHVHQMPQVMMVQQVLRAQMAQLEPWPWVAHDLQRHRVHNVLLVHLAQHQLWPMVAHDLQMHHLQQALLVQMGGHQSMLHVHVPVLWLALLLQA
jgi:hypothetical protein